MSTYSEALKTSADNLGAWRHLPFFEAGAFASVLEAIKNETATILPESERVFAGLQAVQPDAVRAVILGQDPYPTLGHANGLAFSVQPDVTPLPRSLNNIFKELDDDIGGSLANGDLTHWAKQGVLLLNSALTVRVGEAGSHAKIGWSRLIEDVIQLLSSLDKIVWILWGKHAQSLRPLIDAGGGNDALIIESAHPSPLSARRGFFGSKPFSQTNNHLKANGLAMIDWAS